MKEMVAVFIGGGLGSILRYGLSRWLYFGPSYSFPLSTLVTNVLACFMLGIIVGLADQKMVLSPVMRLFWAVGFCGGFSTFSTFSYENLLLLQTGQNASVLLYVALSLLLCVAATFSGQFLALKL